jgi:Niemann-Pick C1 N terminus
VRRAALEVTVHRGWTPPKPLRKQCTAAQRSQDQRQLTSAMVTAWQGRAGGRLCCSGEQAQVMQTQLRMAEPFIIGCPACLSNFRNLFCALFCAPDQATFTDVTATQQAHRKGHNEKRSAVKEVSFYLSETFKNETFDSCKDVIFGTANNKAMLYIGSGATDAQVRCIAALEAQGLGGGGARGLSLGRR